MAAESPRVAIVKLSSLGDVVHALPVAAALRAHAPDARLTWIVERREAPVLRDHPALDEIVVVDTRAWRRVGSPPAVLALARTLLDLRRRLRAGRFDVAIDVQGLLKSGVLTAATGARRRIGFAAGRCREPVNALFTNHRVTPPPGARHVVDQYLALLEPLGVRAPRVEFRLARDDGAEARIEEFFATCGLKSRQRVVVLNPGAGRPAKRWPPERFRALAERLSQDATASPLVVWGPGELAVAREIVEVATTRPGPRAALAPATDLPGLVAVLRRASVVVGGDTGPLHLAAALGTPCVGLYGPTVAERNGPYGPGHRTLQSPDGALAAIEVDAVFQAVIDVLDGGGR